MSDETNVQRALGRIEGKLDALAITMTTHSAQDDVRFHSIEKKLETLQQSKWYNSGVSAAVASAMSFVVIWFKGH